MKIALAADLHFGSVPEGLADSLRLTIEAQAPDAVVVAGDLTLGARDLEFLDAAGWLQSFQVPTLVIPGNHDVPHWNLVQRFAGPFRRYSAAANAATLMPELAVADGFILGFNTTGSWQPHLSWQEGVARRKDILAARTALCAAPPGAFKVVAGHHPFAEVAGIPRARPVRRAALALQAFAVGGAEVILSGHLHLSYAVEIETDGIRMLTVGAPTALSSRMRGEQNGFWIIESEDDRIVCTLWLRQKSSFVPISEKMFQRRAM